MEAQRRIKAFLKNQLIRGHITKSDLLRLTPEHLMRITRLKDIDPHTITETLQLIKSKVNPDLMKEDVENLLGGLDNMLTDQVQSIMNGRK